MILFAFCSQVCGALGPCTSLEKRSSCLGETEVGVSGTSAWNLCAMDPNTTIGVIFELPTQVTMPAVGGQRVRVCVVCDFGP